MTRGTVLSSVLSLSPYVWVYFMPYLSEKHFGVSGRDGCR